MSRTRRYKNYYCVRGSVYSIVEPTNFVVEAVVSGRTLTFFAHEKTKIYPHIDEGTLVDMYISTRDPLGDNPIIEVYDDIHGRNPTDKATMHITSFWNVHRITKVPKHD